MYQNPPLQDMINSLRLRLYLNIQAVPCSKHNTTRLYKTESLETAPSDLSVMNCDTNGQEQPSWMQKLPLHCGKAQSQTAFSATTDTHQDRR